MKKVFSFIFLMSFMLVSFHAKADDCSKTMDVVSDAFNKMSQQVNQCRTLEEFNNLNFDNILEQVDIRNFSEECFYATFTPADKSKLKKSINNFSDTVVNKVYEFAGGMLSKEEIRKEMAPTINVLIGIVNESVNFDEWCQLMEGASF